MINKRLLSLAPSARTFIWKNVFYQWISLLASILISSVLALMLTAMKSSDWILPFSSCLFLLAAAAGIRMLCVKKAAENSVLSSLEIKSEMRNKVFEKLTAIGPEYTKFWNTSELVQLMQEGTEQLETYFANYLPQFFYALLAPLTLFFFTLFLDWKAAVVLLVCVPLIPASIVFVQKFAKKLLNRYWSQYVEMSDSFLENLQGLSLLKVYDADERYHEKMNREAEQFRKITMRVLIMQLNSISVMDLVAFGGAAAGIFTAFLSLKAGSLSFFGAVWIVLLSAEFFIPMRLLGSYFHIAMNGSAAADKMFAILDHPVPAGQETQLHCKGELIRARNLSFSYGPEEETLKDLSFSFPEKGFYGITGMSGSGKSTLASLLTGRNREYRGSLQIGKQSAADISIPALMEHVSLLSHDSWIFSGTIRSNLLFACHDASDEKCWQALEQAGAASFLKKKDGLDTVVEEGGRNFSSGQKQRIALARMLMTDSSILILDEAASSMDAVSENIMMKAAEKIAEERLVLCISHRLANIAGAEKILVMKEGRIAETGRHESLLKQNGEYARLWKTQKELEAYAKGDLNEE